MKEFTRHSQMYRRQMQNDGKTHLASGQNDLKC